MDLTARLTSALYVRDLVRALRPPADVQSLTAIARGHQNHDTQLVQYGQSTLRQLRASG